MGIRRCPATVTTFRVWKSEYQITAGIGFLFRRGLRIDTDACHACAAPWLPSERSTIKEWPWQ